MDERSNRNQDRLSVSLGQTGDLSRLYDASCPMGGAGACRGARGRAQKETDNHSHS